MPQGAVIKSIKLLKIILGLIPYMGASIIMLLRAPCGDFNLGPFLKVLLIFWRHLYFCDMCYFGTMAFLLLYLENIISICTYKLHPCSESSWSPLSKYIIFKNVANFFPMYFCSFPKLMQFWTNSVVSNKISLNISKSNITNTRRLPNGSF